MTGEEVARAVWLGVWITVGALGVLVAFLLLPGHGRVLMGPRGIRLEDDVVVGASGPEVISSLPLDLVELEA